MKKKVLVVEDDESIREAMKELLELEGFDVDCAVNGDDGIQRLKRYGANALPNLILLDIMMPVKDGFQFREEQLREPGLSAIPVVIMTADGNIESKRAVMGARDAIKKPFNIDAIMELVHRYCGGDEPSAGVQARA